MNLPRVHALVIMCCVEFAGTGTDSLVAEVERKLKIIFGQAYLEQMERELPNYSQTDVRKIAMGDYKDPDEHAEILIDMAVELAMEDRV